MLRGKISRGASRLEAFGYCVGHPGPAHAFSESPHHRRIYSAENELGGEYSGRADSRLSDSQAIAMQGPLSLIAVFRRRRLSAWAAQAQWTAEDHNGFARILSEKRSISPAERQQGLPRRRYVFAGRSAGLKCDVSIISRYSELPMHATHRQFSALRPGTPYRQS